MKEAIQIIENHIITVEDYLLINPDSQTLKARQMILKDVLRDLNKRYEQNRKI